MARNSFGEPYDPAIRETALGSRLYQTWRRVRRNRHDEEWDYFPTFYDWAIKSGYTLGAWLMLKDDDEPFCPENCVWHIPGSDIDIEWVSEWNRAVNRIRKHYGMPPLEGTSYDDL